MARPIFCVAHPRACSTAFERVFMTREDDLVCLHEPFGDAFYYGPERLSSRYENDTIARHASGFSESTFKNVLDRIYREESEGKRIFIKDISYYTLPPHGQQTQIAPSLAPKRRGIGTETLSERPAGSLHSGSPPFPYGTEAEPENPTVIPEEVLKKFHFTFLIRDPHYSVPSFFRGTIPPLDQMTGWSHFDPSEAGYREQRNLFDFLLAKGHIGPKLAGQKANLHRDPLNGVEGIGGAASEVNGHANGSTVGTDSYKADQGDHAEICVVDADALLDDPEGIIKEYCRSVGLAYSPKMLNWDSEQAHEKAKEAFEKWKGWHEDALDSKGLTPRPVAKKKQTEEGFDVEWTKRFGKDSAGMIRTTVDANMADYLYLKQFAMNA